MKDLDSFLLSPNPVPANASITVQFSGYPIKNESYQIINESGNRIRSGKVTNAFQEFSFSVGGMPDGSYWLVMGDKRERFTIV